VLDSRGQKIKGLFMRGGKFYIKIKINRKLILHMINRTTAREAVTYMREYLGKVAGGEVEEIEARRHRDARPAATLAEILAAYRAARAGFGDPRPATVEMNCYNLRRVVETSGFNLGTPATEWMTLAVLDKFRNVSLTGAPDLNARRITIRSHVRAARSVLCYRSDFRDLRLPELEQLNQWLEYQTVKKAKPDRRWPSQEVITRTVEAGRKLAGPLSVVWALVYDLAMRASEARAARWDWVRLQSENGYVRAIMDIESRPDEDFAVKTEHCAAGGGSTRHIPIPPPVLVALGWVPGTPKPEGFILPGKSPTARRELIEDDFSAWVVALDPWWMKQSKFAHRLRGWRGGFWALRYGYERCCAWIGHRSFQTTLTNYADIRDNQREEPLPQDEACPYLATQRMRPQ